MAVTRLKYWPTLYSMVMPIPPCSWIAPWPTMRPERPICTLAAEIALRRSLASGSATIIVASIAMLRACSSATNMSTARCCSTWKLPIGTPNCLRVRRWSRVSSCIAAHDQLVGGIAVEHEALLSVDDVAHAVALGAGRYVGEVVARLALGVREGEQHAALGDFRQDRVALCLTAGVAQQAAGEHHGREIGLERERAAERLGDDHGLDQPAAEAAVRFVERQAEQAELGVSFPQRAAEAGRLLHVRLALLEIVAVGEQALDAVLEQPLLLAELEVHNPPHTLRPSFRKGSEASISGIHNTGRASYARPMCMDSGLAPSAPPEMTTLRCVTTPVSPWR